MATATIKLVQTDRMVEFYMNKDQAAVARRLLKEDAYVIQGTMGVPGLEGEDVAEEIFDLTNNPGRQDERDEQYDRRYRSVSVGDIVRVDGVNYLCASFGWERI
jgi:hypothetical protein